MEIGLRVAGYSAGQHTKVHFFHPVDSLETLNGHTVNPEGILIVEKSSAEKVKRHISLGDTSILSNELIEIQTLAHERLRLLNGKFENMFSNKYFQLINTKRDTLHTIDVAFLEFVKNPINADGFRSIPFKLYPNNKPSVLLLGDSFTWGMSASSISNSFADILLARGYTVYNTGISATDVAQYMAIAKKYIPILKPDYVIVNFYLGNDITYYQRNILPNEPLLYATNAGILMANPHGKFLNSAEKAYDITYRHYCIPQDGGLFNDIMRQTATSTVIWRILRNNGVIPYDTTLTNYYKNTDFSRQEYPVSNQQLNEIKSLAEQFDSKFILSSIPTVDNGEIRYAKDFPYQFDGLKYYEMLVELEYYKLSDGHFNDLGHQRYANFLQEIIDGKR
jgi:hypothetical protein